MSDDAPKRMVFEFPLSAGASWLERAREAAAPHVLRLGEIERPDKLVLICELVPARQQDLVDALQTAWEAFGAGEGAASE